MRFRLFLTVGGTGGVRTASPTTVGRDRDDAIHFIEILQFPSYEEAMRNSNLPETSRVHETFADLCVEYPKFINLDVIVMKQYNS